eukprot:TRINITY_DN8404_c0_g1_i1.p2 TRINITY_DN8404_c0_g1~~TRINITY_DN8404_c0_g1_i1.p2  ORF type:complete len:164 (+),score=10.93 TRINITY_DN8404_c0_g1_i1:412-903(+)
MEKEGRAKEAKQLRFMIEKKKLCKDDPESADIYSYRVSDGDIFVLGTDGIFDNVFSYEIKEIIKGCMLNVTRITNRVAKVLYTASVGNRRQTGSNGVQEEQNARCCHSLQTEVQEGSEQAVGLGQRRCHHRRGRNRETLRLLLNYCFVKDETYKLSLYRIIFI